MLTVIVGLGSALIFGAADFLGGLASKRVGAILTTGLAATVGIGVFALIGFAVPGRWSWEAIGYGALSGVFGAVAIGLLYACLAIGPMSILSPLTALVSAVTPLIVAVGYGESIAELAPKYPDVKFEHATGIDTGENIATYFGASEDTIYLTGLAAGAASESGSIGFVAPFPIPEVIRHINAFDIGAKETNPDDVVKVVWINTWFDPAVER